jgi:hypothetical protein
MKNIFYLTGFKPSTRAFFDFWLMNHFLMVTSMDVDEAENSSIDVFEFKKFRRCERKD